MNKVYTQPKHHIAIDCAIFGYQDGEIKLLLYPSTFEPHIGKWSLVGGFVGETENIRDAAERIMLDSIGLEHVFMKEVCTFSDVDRDATFRVISVLHYALIRVDELHLDRLETHGAKWFSIKDLPDLILDYDKMIEVAYIQLQIEANDQLLGKELLPPFFTLLQLRKVYDCIFQREFEPANFRKKILSLGILKKHVFKNKTDSKKGAFYYTFDPVAESRTLDRIVSLK
ncbi:MAG: NUDIX domain-containing protein [Bacteroidales bacterium]|jgi:8-oxo-dGTP diphosphatase|nr:NUDIX domain-containing protein [Bacteroidales bacterium]